MQLHVVTKNSWEKGIVGSPVKNELNCAKTTVLKRDFHLTQGTVLEDQEAKSMRKQKSFASWRRENSAMSLPSAWFKLLGWFKIKSKEIFDSSLAME